jgi:2-formylbenzoate dehydrogenase
VDRLLPQLPEVAHALPPLLDQALGRELGLLIDGRIESAAGGRAFVDHSPVTEGPIAELPDAAADDVGRAVRAAARAAPGWARTPARERGRRVRELAAVLLAHADELALLDAIDVGNPVTHMRRGVAMAADAIEMFADWSLELRGETIPASAAHLHLTTRRPYGVVARIVAFNHPLMFAASKIAAPLVAGNAVVLKPSDVSPLSALRMGELVADVLPPGVLNVVVGAGAACGQALVAHPAVRRIAFTGSAATGRAIQRDAADAGVKHVTLELGGKNAIIVCADADLDRAADAVVAGMNFAGVQGQSCGSTSRLLVSEAVREPLLAGVLERIARIRIGSPLDPETEMGTLASRAQHERVLAHIAQARALGAQVLAGGGPPDLAPGPGLFIAPTVLGDVTPEMSIARDEVFGPVLSVIGFDRPADALAIANDSAYGLTAAVWTSDVVRAHRMAHELEAGYVWINGSARHFPGVPFGGVKGSGIGREESREELESYAEIKAINVMLEGGDV